MSFRDGNRFTGGALDNCGLFINIDNLCEAFTEVQRKNNVEPTFKLADVNDEGQKSKHDKSIAGGNRLVGKPDSDKKKKKSSGRNAIEAGDYWMIYKKPKPEDSNGSVCDYCHELGYKSKYDPGICDNCDVCLECVQYDEGECVGCKYSTHIDGKFYREKLSDDEYYTGNDKEIFDSIEEFNEESLYTRYRKYTSSYDDWK